ncbi:MAG: hypothetical protein ACRCTD_13940, partial [Beijerinckiaceae bacterium]
TGVVPVLIGLSALALIGFTLLDAARHREDRRPGILGLCIVLMAAAHAMFDYPMQIAGFAIPCAIITGYCFSASQRIPKRTPRPLHATIESRQNV